MVFLEVLTRCYKRPTLLARNVASLQAQTCADWQQTFLVDDVGRGIGWASENLAAYGPQLVGEYIWCLDDDDLCIRPTLVEELRRICAEHRPDVVLLRMDHGPRGVLPPDRLWGHAPQPANIGMSAFVARRELWQAWAHVMVPGKYESDYELVSALFEHADRVYWHDVIASRVQQIGLGRPE